MTWFVEEEEEPGFWHFFDTVFGSGTHVVPPGELLHLRFRALPGVTGYTRAQIDTIRMTDENRDPLPVASFDHGHIFVGEVGVPEDPSGATLGPASPNPFTSATSLGFSLSHPAAPAELRIYDVTGRLVRGLAIPEGTASGEVEWDGRSAGGTDVAPGVYVVRLSAGRTDARTKILKLR